MSLPPGSLLNQRYRIEAVIAQGGMGALYRAFDQTLNIEVAVKENFFEGEDHARQFRLEGTILAALRHPNLPRVTDHFTIAGQGQYLVMDYIDGEDLRQIAREKGPLPEAEVVRIGAAVCEALNYLHTRQPPIVHRDVKPGNIKVASNGGVFLVDFGLAKVSQSGEHTTTGAQALTPGYAPPEQYGQGTEPRSDIYALGATLYAALTGQVPEDALSRVMGSRELTPIRQHQPAVSLKTALTIEKAMAVAPQNRYQTAQEFRAALLGAGPPPAAAELTQFPAQADAALSGAAGGQAAFLHAPPKGKRRINPIGAILGVVAILAIALFLIPSLKPAPAFPQNELPTPSLPVEASPTEKIPAAALPSAMFEATTAAQPSLQSSLESSPQAALADTPLPTATEPFTPTPTGAGARLSFVSDRTGLPQVWLMQPDDGAPRQVTNLPDGACQPDWDPSGSKLVFVSPCRDTGDTHEGASLFIINADGTGLTPLPTLPGGDFDPAWSPDGERIAFVSLREGRANIFMYFLSDQRVERLSSPVNYERHPAWSPDGAFIAYETTRPGFQQVWIMQADGQNPRAFSSDAGGTSARPAWSPDGVVLAYAQGNTPTFLVGRQYGSAQARESRLTEELFPILNPAYAPDGTWLALDAVQADNRDIYIMMPNGSRITRLTDDPAADYDPTWK